MAERLKDEEDAKIDSLFRSDPVRDDGFSDRVLARVRRRIWVRRLSLPIAMLAGAAIAVKPVLQLAESVPDLLGSIPISTINVDQLPIGGLPQVSTLIMGLVLLAAVMLIGRILEEA